MATKEKNPVKVAEGKSGKRYWFMQLPEDFFAEKQIRTIRKKCGIEGVYIFLRLMLESVKSNAILTFEHIEETFAEELEMLIDDSEIDAGAIQAVLDLACKHGWIMNPYEGEQDSYMLPYVADHLKSRTQAADRMQNMRDRKKSNDVTEECNNVTITRTITEHNQKESESESDKQNETHMQDVTTQGNGAVTPRSVGDVLPPVDTKGLAEKQIELWIKDFQDKSRDNLPADSAKGVIYNIVQGFASMYKHRKLTESDIKTLRILADTYGVMNLWEAVLDNAAVKNGERIQNPIAYIEGTLKKKKMEGIE